MTLFSDAVSNPAENDPSSATALLLIEGQRNRELLRSVLTPEIETLVGPDHLADDQIDLIITDRAHTRSHRSAIRAMQENAEQVFLPVLLLVSSQSGDSADIQADDWDIIDETLTVPVRRRQLELRIKMLLRARQYSRVSARRYRQLQDEMDALQQQKEEFQRLFTASGDPIVLTSNTGQILKANPAAHRLVQSGDDTLQGRSFKTFFTDEQLVDSLCERLREETSIEDVETTMRRIDGTSFIGNISASMHYERSRGGGACQFIIRDISEAKAYERQLVEAREEAEEMNRLKSAFLANMSHEIRTPLASIIGYADLLVDQVPDALRTFVEIIQTSGERLLTTLDSVLTLAQLESGSMEMRTEEVDVEELVHEIEESFRAQVEQKELYFHVDRPDEPVVGRLDQRAVARILSNLVHNAVKFTREGGITVTIDEAADGTGCLLKVSDTGIGMDEALVSKLFEAFRQASTGKARQYEGSGLGLTLIKELVNLIDGSLTVDSTEGDGTTVTVRIPWATADDEPERKTLHSARRWGLDALPDDQHVLIVDDDPLVRDLLVEMLPESYDIDAVGDASEALSSGKKHAYDLILLDINLKDNLNGVDVHERLRDCETGEDALIIAITAYAQEGDGEHFHESGFDGYVPKPFTRESLFENLIQILN